MQYTVNCSVIKLKFQYDNGKWVAMLDLDVTKGKQFKAWLSQYNEIRKLWLHGEMFV